MTPELARKALQNHGFDMVQEKRLPNDSGTQLRLRSGQIVNVFDKGTWYVQGKNPEAVQAALQAVENNASTAPQPSKQVLVVYGHDALARTQLDAMLRRWGLDPLFLDELPSEGQTIIEKLERYRASVQFAVVLATPDDEGYRARHEDEKKFRARQNVVLELGMMLAVLGRRRVVILLKNPETMDRPSDIQGLIYIPFKDSVDDARVQLAKELNAQGFQIDIGRL